MTGPVFPGEPITAEDVEIQRLAATRAALDPDRQRRRADILLSAIVELLSTKGDRTTESIVAGIRQIWRTTAVTYPEVESALRQAQVVGLVVTTNDLSGESKWTATPGTVAESQQDRKWARHILAEFEEELTSRLDDLGIILQPQQLSRTSHELLRSLADGCRVIDDAPPLGVDFLRPVEFATSAVKSSLQRVEPKQLRVALTGLVDGALDPDDPFANEVIHLLIVGSVLQTFVSKRDLGTQLRLDGNRLLLDTPILVDLMDDGSPGQRLALNLIELSKRLGAQVFVAEHTISEWERLWDGAERENPAIFDSKVVPTHLDRLISARGSNPFISQYLREKAGTPELTWRSFRTRTSNVRHRLTELGMVCRDSGNVTDDDQQVEEEMKRALHEISTNDSFPGKRRKPAAEADAKSAAMIRRWRRKYPMTPCGAFFISSEHLTGAAYKMAFPDDEPCLTARAGAWVVFAASLISDDPSQQAEVAEMVGNALFRESFLGLATAYTLEEAAFLANMITEQSSLSLIDSRTAVQLDLAQLLEGHEASSTNERMALVGAEVIRRRSGRRDSRALRMEQRAADATASAERVKGESMVTLSSKISEFERSDATKQAGIEERDNTIRKLKRGLAVLVGAVVLSILIGGLVWGGQLHGKSMFLAGLFGAVFVIEGVRYSLRLNVAWWEPVLAGFGTAVWTIVGTIIGTGHP
jgi:hypothetical protein